MYIHLIILNQQMQCRKDVYDLLSYLQKIVNVCNSLSLRRQLNIILIVQQGI